MVRFAQATVEYFVVTAVSMYIQQEVMRFRAVRDYIGLPPEWPNVGAAPLRTGTI